MARIGNSEVMIIFGVLGGTLALGSFYTYYRFYRYFKKYLREKRRIKSVKKHGRFVTPDKLGELFEKVPQKDRKKGIEVPLYGFSMSTKTFLLY